MSPEDALLEIAAILQLRDLPDETKFERIRLRVGAGLDGVDREEYKRGFLDGAQLRKSAVAITLQALDALVVGEGVAYSEARKMLDEMDRRHRGEA